MSNKKTEQLGIDAVIQYEFEKYRRKATRVHKCGFDLVSKNKKEERHIEVKSTKKKHFSDRWLESLEWQCAQKDPHFYLYLVTEVSSRNPKIFKYDREKLSKRYKSKIHHYNYRFPKSDFT